MESRSSNRDALDASSSQRGLFVAAIGTAVMAIIWGFSSAPVLLAAIGAAISWLAGWLVHVVDRVSAIVRAADASRLVGASGRDDEPWTEFVALVRQAVGSADPLLRDLTLAKTAKTIDDLRRLANGRVTFTSTETWRAAYEKALSDPSVTDYRSVSWVKTEDYWQDVPGQQSMRLNYDLINRGVRIERILILG